MGEIRQQPDFIIGGAPRSGTTWLYHVLDRHPSVHMAKPLQPEPKFFLVDDLYERGIGYYRDTWFAAVPEEATTGEKSTNYLESPTAARRIHRHLPGVRLIFSLREPADRALSNWRWSRMNGMEDLSFEEALRREPEREANYPPHLRFTRPHSYFSRGLYAHHLRPFVDLFALERILCLPYEDIAKRPGSVAAEVHEFLGLPARPEDGKAVGTVNPSEPAGAEEATVERLRERYAGPNRELEAMLGPRFSGWGR